MEQKKRALVFT